MDRRAFVTWSGRLGAGPILGPDQIARAVELNLRGRGPKGIRLPTDDSAGAGDAGKNQGVHGQG